MGLLLNPFISFPAASAGVNFTLLDSQTDTTNTNAFTFTLDLSGGAAGQIIALIIHARGNNALDGLSSVTVDSNSANERIDIAGNDGGNNRSNLALYTYTLAGSDVGSTVVTYPQTKLGCVIEAYLVENPSAEAPDDSASGTLADPIDLASITTAAGGGVLAATTVFSSTGSVVWTGVTERTDNAISDPGVIASVAYDGDVAGGSVAVTVDNSVDSTNAAAFAATWDPA